MKQIQGSKFFGEYEEALDKLYKDKILYADQPYNTEFLNTFDNLISNTDLAKHTERGAYGKIKYIELA